MELGLIMNQINYVEGNALEPMGEGNKIIIHCCNDLGIMGAGIALQIKKKWPDVFNGYRQWYINESQGDPKKYLPLGEVQFVPAGPGLEIGNMIGQRGVGTEGGRVPVKYPAIKKCLKTVFNRARALNATVHAPRFGAGLAGGDWAKIEQIIQDELTSKGITVVIYDYVPPADLELNFASKPGMPLNFT